jgi:hypothetical protein
MGNLPRALLPLAKSRAVYATLRGGFSVAYRKRAGVYRGEVVQPVRDKEWDKEVCTRGRKRQKGKGKRRDQHKDPMA